jgi:hypothetical protein
MYCSTCGTVTNDLTLGSQSKNSSSSCSSSPSKSEFFSCHRAASMTSHGYVAAIKTCANNTSGYNAIGASKLSSASCEIGVLVSSE